MNLKEIGAMLWRYVFRVLVSIDQLANTLLGGNEDETISSRAGMGRRRGSKFWAIAAALIDLLFLPFERDHCEKSIEWDEYPTKGIGTPAKKV